MKIKVEVTSPKHRERFTRCIPFIEKAFERLKVLLPRRTGLPKTVILKAKRHRMTSLGVAMCMEWGRYGFGLWPGEMWISMDMEAQSYKFRETLLHEIAHIGSDTAYSDNTHGEQWAGYSGNSERR